MNISNVTSNFETNLALTEVSLISWPPTCKIVPWATSGAYLEPSQTSTTELFVKIVNGLKHIYNTSLYVGQREFTTSGYLVWGSEFSSYEI